MQSATCLIIIVGARPNQERPEPRREKEKIMIIALVYGRLQKSWWKRKIDHASRISELIILIIYLLRLILLRVESQIF